MADEPAFPADALLEWFRRHGRDLPWRRERTAYRTVVSEFMLQQTRVDTVLPYFERWMGRFPDFESLAAASEEEVLSLWQGLGYYSRARNLHALARAVTRRGALPRTAAGWRELPGVGPYTAAAVASLAFGDPAAVVDGNVVRVLSRFRADETEYRDRGAVVRAHEPIAREILPESEPGMFNEAMMELGATVCHRRRPLCAQCPLRAPCRAAARGNPESYPRVRKAVRSRRTVARVWWVEEGAVLLSLPRTGRRLRGLWEIPEAALLPGVALAPGPFAVRRRAIGREDLLEEFYLPAPGGRAPADPANHELRWWAVDDLAGVSLSGPHRRWMGEFLAGDGPG